MTERDHSFLSKKIYHFLRNIIAFLGVIFCTLTVHPQISKPSITLFNKVSNNDSSHNYVAFNYVKLSRGFHYSATPSSGFHFNAKIDKDMTLNVLAIPNPIVGDTSLSTIEAPFSSGGGTYSIAVILPKLSQQ